MASVPMTKYFRMLQMMTPFYWSKGGKEEIKKKLELKIGLKNKAIM